MKLLLLIALVSSISGQQKSPIRYDGFEVYRVTPRTIAQLQVLKQLEDNPQGYSFWTNVSGIKKPVDIMVPPHLKYNFQDLLVLQNLEAKLWIENVQDRIENEKRKVPKTTREHDWKEYQTIDEINHWLDSLSEKYSDVVTPVVGGRSHEGREIRGVKISFGPGKRGVFIEGGIHANEWISPATVTYMLNELVTSKDPVVRAIAESRDWHVFPSINPDGYVYTHTTDRMWRKTRKPYSACVGADPNRNWDYHWMDGGASSWDCSSYFAGSSPFSESETRTLSEYINTVADSLDAYLAFHAFSQMFLIPFGHNGLEVPENNEELLRIGNDAAKSLAVRYGTEYVVGNVPETIYSASAASIDWVAGVHRNIRIVYSYELRDQGEYGMLLPPEQIIPTGEETLDSVIRIIQEIDKV